MKSRYKHRKPRKGLMTRRWIRFISSPGSSVRLCYILDFCCYCCCFSNLRRCRERPEEERMFLPMCSCWCSCPRRTPSLVSPPGMFAWVWLAKPDGVFPLWLLLSCLCLSGLRVCLRSPARQTYILNTSIFVCCFSFVCVWRLTPLEFGRSISLPVCGI